MDVRIGVTQAPREIAVEVDDSADARAALKASIDAALAGTVQTLWITDKKGREIAVSAGKIAYVELGSPDSDRRIGFGG